MKRRMSWLRTLAWLVSAASLVGFLIRDLPRREFRLWALDVGQGDAILLQTDRGNQILIDGGPGDQVLPALGARMPFWDRTVERVLLTHPHADHLTGLIEILRRYRVGEVWFSGAAHATPEYAAWTTVLQEKKIPVRYLQAGDELTYDGVQFAILFPLRSYAGEMPRAAHDATVVARVSYRDRDILLTGDISEEHERAILAVGCPEFSVEISENCPALAAEVLKVPHHGSRTGLLPAFLTAVNPSTAIISAGAGNPYGHPHPSILEKLTAAGIATYRTDTHGTIEIRSDGSINPASAQ